MSARGVTSSHSTMPNQSSAAVYLLASARPPNRPTASHQPSPPARFRRMQHRASAHSAAVQNTSSGVSGVIITAPTPNSSVAFEHHRGMQASLAIRQQVLGRIGEQ